MAFSFDMSNEKIKEYPSFEQFWFGKTGLCLKCFLFMTPEVDEMRMETMQMIQEMTLLKIH